MTTLMPADWDVKSLAELGGRVTSGSRGWAKYYSDHGDLFVRITNLRRSSVRPDLTSCRYVEIDPDEAEARRTRLRSGDILVSITADIGIIGLIPEGFPEPAYINQHIARVRLDPRLADSRFVAYYLASWTPQRRFAGVTDQGAKAGMNLTAVANLESVVPPRQEQGQIADAIDDAVDLIESLERLVAKKRSIKQGMMQALLTGATRLPGHVAAWRTCALGDVTAVDPESLTPANTLPGEEIDYVALEDVSKGSLLGSTRYRFGAAPSRARRKIVPGDVLFGTVRPNLQSHAMYRGGLRRPVASTGFAVIRCREGVTDSGFLAQWVLSGLAMSQVERIIAGSNYPAVTSRDVRQFEVYLPDVDEQREIGCALADADREIEAVEHRLAAARAIKTGMTQELLTGRTRLPVEVAS